MVALTDILPQSRTVRVAGGELELHGLSLRTIGELLTRFPALRALLLEGAAAFDVETMSLVAPEAMAAIIAEAAHQPEAAEAIARGALTVAEIFECLVVVRDLTLPSGVSPLLRNWAALVGHPVPNGHAPNGMGQDTNSSSPPTD